MEGTLYKRFFSPWARFIPGTYGKLGGTLLSAQTDDRRKVLGRRSEGEACTDLPVGAEHHPLR